MKGHKLFIFLMSGTLAATDTLALGSGDFPSELVKLLTRAFTFVINGLQNQIIRNGLSLIFLAFILYQVYASAIKMIKVLSESAGVIATPLSGLSVLAIYWKVKPEVISAMFLWLAAALGIIYIIKGFMWLSNLFGGGQSHNRVIRDERQEARTRDGEYEIEKVIRKEEGKVIDGIKDMLSRIKDGSVNLEEAYSELDRLEQRLDELESIFQTSMRRSGRMV